MQTPPRRLAVVAIIALGVVALAGCGDDDEDNGANGGAGATIDVTLSEWIVSPDPASAAAGSIEFVAMNEGVETHELVVVKTELAPDALPTDADGKVEEEAEGLEVIGEIEEFDAGSSESATFDLEPGSYVLFCNIVEEEESGEKESHYQEGMHAAFTVE